MKKNVKAKRMVTMAMAAAMISANAVNVFANGRGPGGHGQHGQHDSFEGGTEQGTQSEQPTEPTKADETNEDHDLMAGGTVGHIDIDMEVTATVIVGDEVKDVTTTIGVSDADNIDITAKQGEETVEQITEEEYKDGKEGFVVDEGAEINTGNPGNDQVRIEGIFPVGENPNITYNDGEKGEQVEYTVTLEKEIEVDGELLDIIASATAGYWSENNICPGTGFWHEYETKAGWSAGIDLELNKGTGGTEQGEEIEEPEDPEDPEVPVGPQVPPEDYLASLTLQKVVVDSDGNELQVAEDTDFEFNIYEGETSEGDPVKTAVVTVKAGESKSGYVIVNDLEKGTYTVIEVTPDNTIKVIADDITTEDIVETEEYTFEDTTYKSTQPTDEVDETGAKVEKLVEDTDGVPGTVVSLGDGDLSDLIQALNEYGIVLDEVDPDPTDPDPTDPDPTDPDPTDPDPTDPDPTDPDPTDPDPTDPDPTDPDPTDPNPTDPDPTDPDPTDPDPTDPDPTDPDPTDPDPVDPDPVDPDPVDPDPVDPDPVEPSRPDTPDEGEPAEFNEDLVNIISGEEIAEEEVPLAPVPEIITLDDGTEIEIVDEDIPLGDFILPDVPQTGDVASVYAAASGMSLFGFLGLALTKLRRRK